MVSKKSARAKYALMTGATSGFGYEFAKLLAGNGFNLVLIARSEAKLRDLAAEITHGPSREERKRIDRATGGVDGDYESHEDHIHTKE